MLSLPRMARQQTSLSQPEDDTPTAATGDLTKPCPDARQTVLKDNGDCDLNQEEDGSVLKSQVLGTVSERKTSPYAEILQHIFPIMNSLPNVDLKMEMGEEFVCGWGAAFINITATFPLNKAIFRQQLQGIRGYKAVAQLKNEGLRNLYRGLLPPLLLKTTTMSVMFGSYKKFQRALDSTFPYYPQPVNHAMAAMLAGTLEMTLTPFERIQTLLQDRTYHQRFHNTLHAARELRAFGFREYYRGGTIILLRNGPSNVFFFLGKEFVNEKAPAFSSDSSNIAKDFMCGACLGALISTGFFPLNVVKTRMQSQLGGPFVGIRQVFQEVWTERNRRMSNLFRGFHLNYMRSFISWGIINASYEYLLRLFQHFKDEHS